jgi:OmpA-OmpF porin, OOP family
MSVKLIIAMFLLPLGVSLEAQNVITRQPENLGKLVNSDASELCPVITPDGKTLYFVRAGHPKNLGYDIRNEDQDIWYSERNPDGSWGEAKNIGPPMNDELSNALLGITADNTQALVLGYYHNDIRTKNGFSLVEKTKTGWSTPIGLEIEGYDSLYKGGQLAASLSSDGKTILLSIAMDAEGKNYDVFVSHKIPGPGVDWSQFKPLRGINTTDDEVTPFLAADGRTLYFSSDRPGGYGSFDMYFSKRLDDTWEKWSEPVNMGSSINTPYGDVYFTIPASEEYAYFVSSTETAQDDIFRVRIENHNQDPMVLVYGKILNSETKEPLDIEVLVEELPKSNKTSITSIKTDPQTENYTVILLKGKQYGFRPKEQQGYWSCSEYLDMRESKEYKELHKELYITPLFLPGKPIPLNVFFDFDTDSLRVESYPEMERLYTILQDDPKMTIQISGHTDSLGSLDYDLHLSTNRARAVQKYLVKRGISAKRLVVKGFGPSKPIDTNATEEGRQRNRRVEFIALQCGEKK